MPEDAAIHDLRKESGLRNHLAHQVRNILLAFGRKGFLITRTPAESDDYDFSFLHGGAGQSDWGVEQCAAQCNASGGA